MFLHWITALPQTARWINLTGLLLRGGSGEKVRGGDGREGRGGTGSRKGRDVLFFPLSRPVNPKHMHLSDDAQMLFCNSYRANSDWIHKPVRSPSRPVFWTISPSAKNACVFIESGAYFSALTIHLVTYFLYKRSNSNNTSFRAKLNKICLGINYYRLIFKG